MDAGQSKRSRTKAHPACHLSTDHQIGDEADPRLFQQGEKINGLGGARIRRIRFHETHLQWIQGVQVNIPLRESNDDLGIMEPLIDLVRCHKVGILGDLSVRGEGSLYSKRGICVMKAKEYIDE
jgi:hypothetical protein